MVPVMPGGNPYGAHRVIEPEGGLPQPAERVDNDMSRIWDNEILVDVETLNIDSASFTQISEQAGGDAAQIEAIIRNTVNQRGKQHNPVTGSGGVFIGTVAQIGPSLAGRDLNVGDRIVSLVSLSLTPLRLDEVRSIRHRSDQVSVSGQAVLFESGIYATLPQDVPAPLALAILDVAGAPAQTARLVGDGVTVHRVSCRTQNNPIALAVKSCYTMGDG